MATSKNSIDTTTHHFGPFITWKTKRSSQGKIHLHTSRRTRKQLDPVVVDAEHFDIQKVLSEITHSWTTLWAPSRVGWWSGILLMIGSSLFAIGAAMGLWPTMVGIRSIDPSHLGWIFFTGSLFFTSAGILQWLEVINGDVSTADVDSTNTRRWLLFAWHPHNLGYLSVVTQLIGMLFFNLNTGSAFIAGLDTTGENIVTWVPDMVGSVCFLIASHAAILEISHRYWTFQFKDLAWWINAITMIGSILFMASALASFVGTGEQVIDPYISNMGTFTGAVCFFISAYLMIPEQFEQNAAAKVESS